MICHTESKKSRTNKYHKMKEEIQSGLGVMQETTTLSSVTVVIYFRRYFNFYRGELYYLKIASHITSNKANLRDLIAATGLVILLKLDSNRQLISLCDLEI